MAFRIAALVVAGIVTVEGQFLTPTIMGRRLELNPFAVFRAIALLHMDVGPARRVSRRAATDGAVGLACSRLWRRQARLAALMRSQERSASVHC
jgi:hypothetical protein